MEYILSTHEDIANFCDLLTADFTDPPKAKDAEKAFSFLLQGLLNGNNKMKVIQKDFHAAIKTKNAYK